MHIQKRHVLVFNCALKNNILPYLGSFVVAPILLIYCIFIRFLYNSFFFLKFFPISLFIQLCINFKSFYLPPTSVPVRFHIPHHPLWLIFAGDGVMLKQSMSVEKQKRRQTISFYYILTLLFAISRKLAKIQTKIRK